MFSGIGRESKWLWKRNKRKKRKERKTDCFQRIGLGVLAPFLFKFLGAKLSGEE